MGFDSLQPPFDFLAFFLPIVVPLLLILFLDRRVKWSVDAVKSVEDVDRLIDKTRDPIARRTLLWVEFDMLVAEATGEMGERDPSDFFPRGMFDASRSMTGRQWMAWSRAWTAVWLALTCACFATAIAIGTSFDAVDGLLALTGLGLLVGSVIFGALVLTDHLRTRRDHGRTFELLRAALHSDPARRADLIRLAVAARVSSDQ